MNVMNLTPEILWNAFALFVLWPLPLWIFVGIVIASVVIAWRVGRRGRTGWRKLGIGLCVLLGIFPHLYVGCDRQPHLQELPLRD